MNDLDIRLLLTKRLRRKFVIKDPNCLLLDELGICQGEARIDLAVINGKIHGYEIKSDSDTLMRLPSQLKFYSKVFDRLTVVAGAKHIDNVKILVPNWCGLIQVSESSNGLIFKTLRKAIKNPDIDPFSVAQLLWKDEAISILRKLGYSSGLSNKSKTFLWQTLANATTTTKLNQLVRQTLKQRVEWRVDQQPILDDVQHQHVATSYHYQTY